LVNLIEHQFAPHPPNNAYGDGPFTTPGDFSTPNETYFAHADWVVAEASRRGFLVLLAPAYLGAGCGPEGWCAAMRANGADRLRGYGTYVGKRYALAANIVWVHGGDANARTYGVGGLVQAVVDGIKSASKGHLHTAHCFRFDSALDCYDLDWLSLNNTYSDCRAAPRQIRGDYARARRMPFLFIEGRYENEDASAVCLRSQAYWSVLGGATGHVFGNRPIWLFAGGWRQALDSVGAHSMRHHAALFASRPWHRLVPDYAHQAVVAGPRDMAGERYVAAARTPDGSLLIAYLPDADPVTVDMSTIAGRAARAWWFNPTNGEATSIGSFATSGLREFRPPSAADWVLVLDDATFNLPAPGSASSN